MNTGNSPVAAERGAVLATSLIILVVMTLMVLGMLKTSVLELKIGGIAHDAEQNFAVAEGALIKFMNDNNKRFSKNCLSDGGLNNCFCTNPDVNQCHLANVDGNGTSYVAPAGAGIPAKLVVNQGDSLPQAVIVATQTGCAPNTVGCSMNSGCLDGIHVDAQASAQGSYSGEAVVHQGLVKWLPPGSCP